MEVRAHSGKYVVAVSGGVDSIVLLDVLSRSPDMQLIVAHFDHGIRPESAADARFVADAARRYSLPFYGERRELGAGASEARARTARYNFLRRIQNETGATAIITAHHQDDVLETALINLLRGTGRKGMTSLKDRPGLLRPLLRTTKREIKAYALKHDLSWREDTSNHDQRYTRNYIRYRLLEPADAAARQSLLALVVRQQSLNDEIDSMLTGLLADRTELPRDWFNSLPHTVAREVMAEWLRKQRVTTFDRTTIERLVVQCKTRSAGKRADVRGAASIVVTKRHLALRTAER